ncbi:class I adenylate-forming enzyme family protein [Saccharomonospora azurea]|uniref:class I adenylate-forming enzyme family protein n=1 Tax=Saccharomonospora azurea TaxID=40988 RepID=UPI00023FEE22|nr:class I adenylate-forming enzyme family protein [Saccharomonospora azurea]EHK82452.1 AMP-dependent synthetase and ligase [Saccharomonospora azurea SZMC 14600]
MEQEDLALTTTEISRHSDTATTPELTGRTTGHADLGWAEALPYGDVVVRGAALWPDSEALIFPGERLTYAELAAGAERAARSLRGLGIGPGDHVGILMANCPDFARVAYGTTMLGAVAVLINARYQGGDLRHVVTDAEIKILVTGDQEGQPFEMTDRIEAAFADLDPQRPDAFPIASAPNLEAVVVLGHGGSDAPAYTGRRRFDAAAERVTAEEVHELRRQVPTRSVGMMMYTSGTTAKPKGCLLSHEMVVRNGIACGRRLDVRRADRFWDPLPMFHMSSVLPLIACLHVGATFISMQHFEAKAALDLMAGERVTHAYPTFPTVTQAVANHPDFASVDWSELRVVNNVAPPETLRQLQALWPNAALVTAYGSTETGGCVSFSVPTDTLAQRTDTCGPPFPGIQVRVVDPDTGRPVPAGERGEICVRGYSMFEGYHNAPELTAEKTDADGWFHTGDIGTLDADGRITYLGRLKDMLKVGGENVAAVEIEGVLQSHPAVTIAQVVGIPDERLAEVPAAFVELKPGFEVTPEELVEFLRGEIANFKLPHHVRIVTEWPMAATKIQKFRLREALCAELGIAL